MTSAIWRKPFISTGLIFSFVLFAFVFSGAVREVQAQGFSEGFDTVVDNDPMPLPNWIAINHSGTIGATMWYQGDPTQFPSHSGAPNSYIAADYHACTGDNTISLWLLTPQRNFSNGDVVSFWTSTVTKNPYPDRLQFRLSTAGASTDIGVTPTDVGVFSNLLLDINPNLEPGGYPETWTLEKVTLTGLPAGGVSGRIAFRYFVTNGGPGGVNSYYIGIDDFSLSHAAPAAHQESDFDGDGKTDFSLIRNVGGGANGQARFITHINGDKAPDAYFDWGIASDVFLPNDYDGDNRTDYAVWRPSNQTFYIFNSSTSTYTPDQFGAAGDDPTVIGDYDGDGKTDDATFGSRGDVKVCAAPQRCFFYRGTLNNPGRNITYVPFGVAGDFASTGDYDGDGRHDFVVQRDAGDGFARFFVGYAVGGVDTFEWGTPADFVAPGDYDGDGKTDVATVRPSGGNIWWYIRSSISPQPFNYYAPTSIFGNSATDYTCQGDYDGDGRTDIAVWRPNPDPTMNYFYWQGSTSGFASYPWGANGDIPSANWNLH